ncbi:hypothetical protein F53441_2717 [Fusarium austroafricanum]|uniref:Uncharacterized protein n=1 Tax=Fusarium austroafricanum TaxID=2364996 RepID=A0A8H4PBL3_9HYPO|nr:hypothetical protein F53441_2717 [Fusarium austroafricanum]
MSGIKECFQDQRCGHWDFTQDVFGRRRNTAPSELKTSKLYMKLPWPRFEPAESLTNQNEILPNTLKMSVVSQSENGLADQIWVIKGTQQTQKIMVEGCSCRLDIIKPHGRGDVGVHLLRRASQKGAFPDVIERKEENKRLEIR